MREFQSEPGGMSWRRGQGRPVRGSGDLGRDRLLHGARTYLRAEPHRNINRQEIARAAGVTPALVTYYFPHNSELIFQASAPVIYEYLNQWITLLSADTNHSNKLRYLIESWMTFFREDHRLLEALIEVCGIDLDPDLQSALQDFREALLRLVRDGVKNGAWRPIDPSLILVCIWNTCKIAADTSATMLYVPVQIPMGQFDHQQRVNFVEAIAIDLLKGKKQIIASTKILNKA